MPSFYEIPEVYEAKWNVPIAKVGNITVDCYYGYVFLHPDDSEGIVLDACETLDLIRALEKALINIEKSKPKR